MKNLINLLNTAKIIGSATKSISHTFHHLSLFGSFVGAGFTFLELQDNLSEYGKFNEKMENFSKTTDELIDTLAKLKKVKWKVIDETPLDKPYWKKGKGGVNLHFLNIETNETKTLDEMLKYTNLELSMWGLTKVFSKRDGWYIRTLPNKIKFDNLG